MSTSRPDRVRAEWQGDPDDVVGKLRAATRLTPPWTPGFEERQRKCNRCGLPWEYNPDYDASFCRRCNRWLERGCEDPNCDFCANRPARPVSTAEPQCDVSRLAAWCPLERPNTMRPASQPLARANQARLPAVLAGGEDGDRDPPGSSREIHSRSRAENSSAPGSFKSRQQPGEPLLRPVVPHRHPQRLPLADEHHKLPAPRDAALACGCLCVLTFPANRVASSQSERR